MNTIYFQISRVILIGLVMGLAAGCKSEKATPPTSLLESWVTKQYASRVGDDYECVELKLAPVELSDSEKAQYGADTIGYTYTATLRTKKQGYSLVGFAPTLKYATVPAGFSVPVNGKLGAKGTAEKWDITGYSPLILPEVFQSEIVAPSKKSQPEIVGTVASQADLENLKRRLAVR